jgi:hypothetical protein
MYAPVVVLLSAPVIRIVSHQLLSDVVLKPQTQNYTVFKVDRHTG